MFARQGNFFNAIPKNMPELAAARAKVATVLSTPPEELTPSVYMAMECRTRRRAPLNACHGIPARIRTVNASSVVYWRSVSFANVAAKAGAALRQHSRCSPGLYNVWRMENGLVHGMIARLGWQLARAGRATLVPYL